MNKFKLLRNPFKAPLPKQSNEAKLNSSIEEIQKENAELHKLYESNRNGLEIRNAQIIIMQSEYNLLESLLKDSEREVTSLKAIVSGLRSQKIYEGQMYYNPNDHKMPSIKVMGQFNEWYLIGLEKNTKPVVMSLAEFHENYSEYVLLKKINNLKKLS